MEDNPPGILPIQWLSFLLSAMLLTLNQIAGDSPVSVEPGLESWGDRGGRSAADVDLGFSLDSDLTRVEWRAELPLDSFLTFLSRYMHERWYPHVTGQARELYRKVGPAARAGCKGETASRRP